MTPVRIAFHAPLKPPDHPTPSGDRGMARLLIRALGAAGHEVEVASRLRAYDGRGVPRIQAAIRDVARTRAERWLEQVAAGARPRPDLWFTYHLYHKAPDWLGPRIAAGLGVPYVVAEASHAPKRAGGPWDIGYRQAEAAIRAADRVLCLTRLDMACVAPLLAGPERLVRLPPFIDPEPYARAVADAPRARAEVARAHGLDPAVPWLLVVAMMRPGDKLASYQRLAAALARLAQREWRLLVVGDGPARGEVRRALAPLRRVVSYLGALPADALPRVYAASDLYLWPGVGEAYGMAFLEAQAAGLAVVAGRERGIPDVVRDGETGVLTPPGDDRAFAESVRALLADSARRREMGRRATAWVAAERDIAATARRLDDALAGLVA